MAGNSLYLSMCGDEYGSQLICGYKAVATAGTRVQLIATSTLVSGVLIQAVSNNTSDITVAGSDVVGAAGSTHMGINIPKGDSVFLPIRDLSLIWLDSISNGDAVYYSGVR